MSGDAVASWPAMTELAAGLAADNADEVDPRWLRSRTRLLDAAVELLRSGGVDAVTVEAVTKASKVARTTLYRHFGSSSDLLAATLERLLPPGAPPPSTGSLRDRLAEMMCRQATLYEEAPLYLTTPAWAALRGPPPTAPTPITGNDPRAHCSHASSTTTSKRSRRSCKVPKPKPNSASSTSSLPCAN